MSSLRNLMKTSSYILLSKEQSNLFLRRCLASQVHNLNKTTTSNRDGRDNSKQKHSEEARKKYGRYYSMFIGSLVGIFGSSYVLYQKYTQVEAKEIERSSDVESLDVDHHEGRTHSSAVHKSHATFKERKVRSLVLFIYLFIYSMLFWFHCWPYSGTPHLYMQLGSYQVQDQRPELHEQRALHFTTKYLGF